MSLLPFATLPDPEIEAEGSIDPLGVASMAERLADLMLPGLTARMSKPRFLTALAVGAVVIHGLERDSRRTEPYIAFEWGLVTALAASETKATGVPGINKARQALREGAPMSASRYLEVPKVFGFHGIYRKLAVELDLIDRDGNVKSAGERLVEAWQHAVDLPGFLEDRVGTSGGDLRRKLRAMVDASVEANQLERLTTPLREVLVDKLHPGKPSDAEKVRLRALLDGSEGSLRAEVFGLHAKPELPQPSDVGERTFFEKARPKMSAELRAIVDAFMAIEDVARPMMNCFDAARWLSTEQPLVPVTGTRLRDRFPELRADLAAYAARAVLACPQPEVSGQICHLESQLAEARDIPSAFDATLVRHLKTQAEKGPNGRRPWFERLREGYVVRSRYRIKEVDPSGEQFVNQYRSHAVRSFLSDLGGRA